MWKQYASKMIIVLRKQWALLLLVGILLLIVLSNVRPGFFVLGNDNFSPEVRPALTLERSVFSPGWRTYRVLGIASDSEQSDIFRTLLFYLFSLVLPGWVVSQGYLFITIFFGCLGMAMLTGWFVKQIFGENGRQWGILFGGLFYLSSMLTSWIYFFPVQLFVAAYAFLPFTLWRMQCLFASNSRKNLLILLFSSLLLATSAITATMFLVCGLVICFFSLFLFFLHFPTKQWRVLFLSIVCTLGIQLFWLLPFATYVKSNTQALRDSSINREITSSTIENEARYDTLLNVPRYYFSWMDTKENAQSFTFFYRDFYKSTLAGTIVSFIPLFFVSIAAMFIFMKRRRFVPLPLLLLLGWFLIKGVNPPLGSLFMWFQNAFPVLAQVFRWQSSKLWPFLAMTIPILATLGVLLVRRSVGKEHAKRAFVFCLIVSLALLGFIYPYFKGDLVRQKVFVKIPAEYYALADYLDTHDRFGRIYLAPEANTLYFRNYSWGFWGSVFLNYMLRNPIVEKALVTGSYENEQAFTILTNSYYSENPLFFAEALRRYDVRYVLVDGYASKGDVGYAYNPGILSSDILQNTSLKEVWKDGKLTLYRLSEGQAAGTLSAMSPSNGVRLNTILLASGDNGSYFSDSAVPGALYPFAGNFRSVYFDKNILHGSISGIPAGRYGMTLTQDTMREAPTKLSYSRTEETIVFQPSFPEILVEKKGFGFQFPIKLYRMPKAITKPRFLTLGQNIIDLSNAAESNSYLSLPYKFFGATTEVGLWSSLGPHFSLLSKEAGSVSGLTCGGKVIKVDVPIGNGIKCASGTIPIQQNSIVELLLTLHSSSATKVTICLESANKRECLNRNTVAFINQVPQSFSVIPETLIQKGDGVKLFLQFSSQDPSSRVALEDVNLSYSIREGQAVFEKEAAVSKDQRRELSIGEKQIIDFAIPILEGQNTWGLTSGGLLPEVSVVPFDSGETGRGTINSMFGGGLLFENQNSNSSLFPQVRLVDPRGEAGSGIGLVAYQAENTNGIPMTLSIHDTNQEYKLWQEQIGYKTASSNIGLFLLPQALRSYYAEAFATGFGPRMSENKLERFVFQVIPSSWYTMKLVPESLSSFPAVRLHESATIDTNMFTGSVKDKKNVVMIPTAISPNWRLSIGGVDQTDQVVINSWEQGWVVGDIGKANVWFWPNALVYIGFLPLISVLIWLCFGEARDLLRKRQLDR